MTVQPVISRRWLPTGAVLGPLLGQGHRSVVFAARWQGRSVVLKRYRDEAVRKYRRKYGLSIAAFEHDRNLAFWKIDQLRSSVAEPVDIWTTSGVEVFVQQRIQGQTPHDLLGADRRLPAAVLSALDRVVALASAHGLYDIDMSPSNFLLQHRACKWQPVLFDFNLMPQHLYAPNPLVKLLYRTGLRHPAHRDRWMLNRLRSWPD